MLLQKEMKHLWSQSHLTKERKSELSGSSALCHNATCDPLPLNLTSLRQLQGKVLSGSFDHSHELESNAAQSFCCLHQQKGRVHHNKSLGVGPRNHQIFECLCSFIQRETLLLLKFTTCASLCLPDLIILLSPQHEEHTWAPFSGLCPIAMCMDRPLLVRPHQQTMDSSKHTVVSGVKHCLRQLLNSSMKSMTSF